MGVRLLIVGICWGWDVVSELDSIFAWSFVGGCLVHRRLQMILWDEFVGVERGVFVKARLSEGWNLMRGRSRISRIGIAVGLKDDFMV